MMTANDFMQEYLEDLDEDDLLTEDDLDDFEDDVGEDAEDDLDDDFESSEGRRRRRRRRRGRKARGKNYFARRLRGYCTKQECKNMAKRISRDVAKVKTVVNRNSARIASGQRTDRRQNKAISALRKEADSTKQLVMLTTLLGGGDKDFTLNQPLVVDANTTLPAGTPISLKDDSDGFDSLLPLMLLGGSGTSGGGGLFGGGGDITSLLILSKVLDK